MAFMERTSYSPRKGCTPKAMGKCGGLGLRRGTKGGVEVKGEDDSSILHWIRPSAVTAAKFYYGTVLGGGELV